MAEDNKINIWNEASVPGLALGGVSIAYMSVSNLASSLSGKGAVAILIGFLGFVLWAAKFGGCIYLMRWFMLRFSSRNPGADNRMVFRFGSIAALLSSLLYSAFFLLYLLKINPGLISESFDAMLQGYSSVLSSSQMSELENLLPKMPAIMFLVNFIWCYLFGTIVASIFSRKIPTDLNDPFKQQ